MAALLTKPDTLAAAFAVLVMTWLAAAGETWSTAFSFTGQKRDYYNLLVDGFIDGQLHLKTEVHPDLLHPDPEVRRRAPYLLDAGLYGGKYFLYYGVVPAVSVLLPYSLITGHDLGLNIATLGFVLVGFGISWRWYHELQRRFFPRSARWIDTLVVLLLAFGPATTFLIRRSAFYELPLAAGYTFLCGFVWASTRALASHYHPARWTAAASLCVGLAAGCHPNYALLSLLVALTAWWSHRNRGSVSATRLAVAAVLPAAIVGAALAWYNYARFGNPLEFGFSYGVNVFFGTGDKLISAAFIWPNLRWYYLTPPTLLPYFPFIFPADATFRPDGYHGAEAIHGQFLVFILLGWILLGSLKVAEMPIGRSHLRQIVLLLCLAFAMNAAFMFLLGIRANRYMVDFQLPLVALGALLTGHVARKLVPSLFRRIWIVGVVLLGLLTTTFNILAAIQQFDDFRNTRPRTFEALSRSLNPPWSFWESLGLVKTGTLVFDVAFKEQSVVATGEPLLTLGVPGYSDSIYAIQHPGNLVEFYLEHAGYGGPKSPAIPYEPGKRYTMEIELGSFRPPPWDPVFDDVPSDEVHLAKTKARIVFDGRVVLEQQVALYEAAPWQRDLGTNTVSLTALRTHFSGQITHVRWRQSDPVTATSRSSAVISLQVDLPPTLPTGAQPVMSFGLPGRGHLVFLQPAASGEWRIGLDTWGYAAQISNPITISAGTHSLDLVIGPLLGQDPNLTGTPLAKEADRLKDRVLIWLNGRIVADFGLLHHLDAFTHPQAGANINGFSTSEPIFFGHITEITPVNGLYERLPIETPASP